MLQGPWIHPEIDNPEYSSDTELYKRDEICAIGFDLWQVKSGTIFDNVLITDDPEYAKKVGEDVWRPTFVSITLCTNKITPIYIYNWPDLAGNSVWPGRYLLSRKYGTCALYSQSILFTYYCTSPKEPF